MTVAAILGLLAGLVLAALLLRSWESHHARRLLDAWRDGATSALAADAQRRSRAVVTGQVAEQVAPLSPTFPWALEDARFLGRPVDYIVFDGLGEVRRGLRSDLREIVFVDIKTGSAGLTSSERRVRRCVDAGRVGLVDTAPAAADREGRR